MQVASCRWIVLNFFAILLIFPSAQAAVNVIAPERFPITMRGDQAYVPYHSSHDLNTPRREIRHALVIIHGTLRNAEVYERAGARAAEAAGADEDTVIIVPQFLTPDDVLEHAPEEALLYWTNGGWKRGDLSLIGERLTRPGVISSFAVVDQMLRHAVRTYPRLERITVAGHSAGGQFVNRYAAGSRMHDSLAKSGINVQYVVSNPSSYLYFCDHRLVPSTKNEFQPVSDSVRADECARFNRYKFGMEGRNVYMRSHEPDELGKRYAERNVTYLLGEEDNDPEARYLDTRCQALLQGPHRLARGKAYHRYIIFRFGEAAQERHRIHIVPGVGHSVQRMFNSEIGRSVLFDTWHE